MFCRCTVVLKTFFVHIEQAYFEESGIPLGFLKNIRGPKMITTVLCTNYKYVPSLMLVSSLSKFIVTRNTIR